MVTAHHVAESLRHLMHKVFKKAAFFSALSLRFKYERNKTGVLALHSV